MMSGSQLPHQPTAFIGRERELSEIAALLADPNCRLLTLVGTGGIGKTRLALQAAAGQIPCFVNGVYFVALNPVHSTDLMAAAIASALQISLYGSEDPRLQIIHYLHEKHMLLIMDNFEHLLEGTGLLTDILQVATGVKFLATSRERLNIQEEWVLELEGLSFPDGHTTDPSASYSAVQLFVQRARQIKSKFSLSENAEAIKTICQRVEGMPLGLELAATWLRAMSCQQIAAQIGRSLDFLTTPLRNVPERHRSLRAIFDQSWNLLSSAEQDVLMRLSVFRGGFNLEAAEQIAGASLSLLAGLTDKSLIRLNASGRYDMHELLLQYASDKLAEAGETNSTAHRHLDYFMKLADQAESYLFGSEQMVWFDRLEVELDNLRTAVTWSIKSETGLHLASALGWFFSERSYWSEGLACLEQALVANPNAPASLRAKAFHSAGSLAGRLGDNERLHSYCEQAIVIARSIHDDWNMAWALSHLGLFSETDRTQSASHLEESVALFRQIENPMGLAHSLIRLSWIAIMLNNMPYARILVDEAAVLTFKAGDIIMAAWVHATMGRFARQPSDDFKQAQIHFENSILFFDQARMPDGINAILISLAGVELAIGDLVRAQKLYETALTLHTGSHLLLTESSQSRMSSILAGLANIAKTRGHFERAARLLAAANTGWLAQIEVLDAEFNSYESDLAEVRAEIGETAFAEAWTVGAAMTKEQAIAYVWENSVESNKIPLLIPTSNFILTERELEVLRLVAEGSSNQEIADRLFIGLSTVKKHINHIYDKLDAKNRTQAVAFARERLILTP
jgi:predicted ATPase/DNA-binding CsgD family transcriptional regulator